jgi:hypothetical protein
MYGKEKRKENEGKRICASKEEEGGILLMDESSHLLLLFVLLISGGFSEKLGIVNLKIRIRFVGCVELTVLCWLRKFRFHFLRIYSCFYIKEKKYIVSPRQVKRTLLT